MKKATTRTNRGFYGATSIQARKKRRKAFQRSEREKKKQCQNASTPSHPTFRDGSKGEEGEITPIISNQLQLKKINAKRNSSSKDKKSGMTKKTITKKPFSLSATSFEWGTLDKINDIDDSIARSRRFFYDDDDDDDGNDDEEEEEEGSEAEEDSSFCGSTMNEKNNNEDDDDDDLIENDDNQLSFASQDLSDEEKIQEEAVEEDEERQGEIDSENDDDEDFENESNLSSPLPTQEQKKLRKENLTRLRSSSHRFPPLPLTSPLQQQQQTNKRTTASVRRRKRRIVVTKRKLPPVPKKDDDDVVDFEDGLSFISSSSPTAKKQSNINARGGGGHKRDGEDDKNAEKEKTTKKTTSITRQIYPDNDGAIAPKRKKRIMKEKQSGNKLNVENMETDNKVEKQKERKKRNCNIDRMKQQTHRSVSESQLHTSKGQPNLASSKRQGKQVMEEKIIVKGKGGNNNMNEGKQQGNTLAQSLIVASDQNILIESDDDLCRHRGGKFDKENNYPMENEGGGRKDATRVAKEKRKKRLSTITTDVIANMTNRTVVTSGSSGKNEERQFLDDGSNDNANINGEKVAKLSCKDDADDDFNYLTSLTSFDQKDQKGLQKTTHSEIEQQSGRKVNKKKINADRNTAESNQSTVKNCCFEEGKDTESNISFIVNGLYSLTNYCDEYVSLCKNEDEEKKTSILKMIADKYVSFRNIRSSFSLTGEESYHDNGSFSELLEEAIEEFGLQKGAQALFASLLLLLHVSSSALCGEEEGIGDEVTENRLSFLSDCLRFFVGANSGLFHLYGTSSYHYRSRPLCITKSMSGVLTDPDIVLKLLKVLTSLSSLERSSSSVSIEIKMEYVSLVLGCLHNINMRSFVERVFLLRNRGRGQDKRFLISLKQSIEELMVYMKHMLCYPVMELAFLFVYSFRRTILQVIRHYKELLLGKSKESKDEQQEENLTSFLEELDDYLPRHVHELMTSLDSNMGPTCDQGQHGDNNRTLIKRDSQFCTKLCRKVLLASSHNNISSFRCNGVCEL